MLDSDLLKVSTRSAGTYRFEYDRSQVVNGASATVSNLRLIVGFSKKGPFNTPVYIDSTTQFNRLFGSIDRSLEKKGSFFHRSCLTALSAGPILVLNLHAFNPSAKLPFYEIGDLSNEGKDDNTEKVNLYYRDKVPGVFNTNTFWEPTPETFLDALNDTSNGSDGNRAMDGNLYIVNTGKKTNSVLFLKSTKLETKPYEITLKDWYNNDVPAYLNPNKNLQDYFVTAYVLDGDFSDGNKFKGTALEQYWETTNSNSSTSTSTDSSKKNFKLESLNDFLNEPQVTILGRYVGCVIPNFVSKTGQNVWIEKLINDDTQYNGLMMTMNVEAIDDSEFIEDQSTNSDKISNLLEYVDNLPSLDDKKVEDIVINFTKMEGVSLSDVVIPDGYNDTQNVILNTIRETAGNYEIDTTNGRKPFWYDAKDTVYGQTNLFKSLIDREYVTWRYLVDTFGHGLENSSKDVYTKLCKERKSALAIINCPSQAEFKKSGMTPNTIFESKLYSLPVERDGATYGAYYYPFLNILDLSAAKSVPPAAYVSNLYMSKYDSGNPWDAVAGQRKGVIVGNQVVGVEGTLIRDNRDYLEPNGINSIVWQNGSGVTIYANKTAKQSPKSALSQINCREVCIYIQDGVESILRNYIFEVNDERTRLEISKLINDFIGGVKSNGGVYAFNVVMNRTNNTDDVIDNQMGVVDISISPSQVMDKLIQRLTITRAGQLESGSFD